MSATSRRERECTTLGVKGRRKRECTTLSASGGPNATQAAARTQRKQRPERNASSGPNANIAPRNMKAFQ
jgi:hypothetical protein